MGLGPVKVESEDEMWDVFYTPMREYEGLYRQ